MPTNHEESRDCRTNPCDTCKARQQETTIVIKLVIQGTPDDALAAVKRALESGEPQETVNNIEDLPVMVLDASAAPARPRMRALYSDADGVTRFKGNPIVRWLLDEATEGRPCGLNRLWLEQQRNGRFTRAQMREFYQLLGYSVSGYAETFHEKSDRKTRDEMFRRADLLEARRGQR